MDSSSPRPVSARRHTEVLDAAIARVDRLEARLADAVRPILDRAGRDASRLFAERATNHLTAAAANGDVSATSTMVCVRPRPGEADAIADPDGDPPESLHVTLVYLGETDGDLGEIADALRPVAASLAPLEGVVGGYGLFEPAGVGILLPDVRGLVELRVAVCEALLAASVDYARNHGFSPHITVNAASESGSNMQQESYAETIPSGAGRATSSGGEESRRLPDLREEPVAGELGTSEGRGTIHPRTPDRLDAPEGAAPERDPSSSSLREWSLSERGSHGAAHERGTWADHEPSGGELLCPRDAVREEELAGSRGLSRLRAGSDRPVSRSEEGRAYPASAVGLPVHFDAICVVRGGVEEVVLPLVGVPAVTAAGSDPGPPPPWTAPFPDEIVDVDALVAELLAKTDPVRKAMVEQTMTPALEEAGLAWDATNPLTAEALASSAAQVRGIAATTQLNVMRIVRASYQNGLSIPQTSSAIREGMRAASKTRATTIARTELSRAANGGSLAATRLVARATGAKYSKTWRTAPGAPHPRHEDYDGLDGQTVGLEEQFEVGDAQLMFPGDPNGDPGETINCIRRCTMTYETPEGEQESDAEDTPYLGDG